MVFQWNSTIVSQSQDAWLHICIQEGWIQPMASDQQVDGSPIGRGALLCHSGGPEHHHNSNMVICSKNLELFQNSILSSVYDCKILKLDSQWPRPDSRRNCNGFLLLIMHSEALYRAAVPLRVRHWQIEQVEQVMAEAKEKRELILKRLSVTPRQFQDSLAVATVTCSL